MEARGRPQELAGASKRSNDVNKEDVIADLRILIADDDQMVRKALRALLEERPGWKVIGEAANGHEAIGKAQRLRPDVVIMDISMPELDGIAATQQIGQVVPKTEVLVLSQYDSEEMIYKATEAGARGYVLKTDARNVGAAVEAVCQHKPFFSPKLPRTRRPNLGKLSGRRASS